MPYFISDNTDCPDWAVVKEDGSVVSCQDSKQSAIDQMVALSLAEELEPGGELRIESGPPAVIAEIDDVMITADGLRNEKVYAYLDSFDETEIIIVTDRLASDRTNTVAQLEDLDVEYDQLFMRPNNDISSADFKERTAQRLLDVYNVMVAVEANSDIRTIYADLGITAISAEDVPTVPSEDDDNDEDNQPDDSPDDNMDEMRAINQEPPAYMRAAARRGLEYYEQGLAGDGVTPRTIREARAMAEGTVSDDKWIRIAAWIARHLVDLDSPDADPQSDNYPSAGVVAHLLW